MSYTETTVLEEGKEGQIKINIFLGNLHCHSKTASNERIEFTYNNLIQHVSFLIQSWIHLISIFLKILSHPVLTKNVYNLRKMLEMESNMRLKYRDLVRLYQI